MRRMRSTHDAIIIGAGPAGSIAAIALAQQGWAVALIDKSPEGSTKTCGHCLSPRALPILDSLGLLDDVRATATAQTRTLRVHLPNAKPLTIPLDARTDPGLVVERRLLDPLLARRAEQAGAEVIRLARAELTSIEDHGAIIGVRTDSDERILTAPLVIGADGLRSRIARAANLAPRRSGRKFGFSSDASDARFETNLVEMFLDRSGYLGVVQQGACAHLAALVNPARGAREPFAFVDRLRRTFPLLDRALPPVLTQSDVDRFAAASPMPAPASRVAHGPIALVGDAAGYREPFTGEGMAWAIESAHALATVASDFHPGWWPAHASGQYAALWRKTIGARQRRCARIAWILERPNALAFVRRLAAPAEPVAAFAARRVVGT